VYTKNVIKGILETYCIKLICDYKEAIRVFRNEIETGKYGTYISVYLKDTLMELGYEILVEKIILETNAYTSKYMCTACPEIPPRFLSTGYKVMNLI
jgi:hypothetical protein